MALLDAQAGYEGETPTEPEPLTQQAIQLWNVISNGHGGVDWAGFEFACASLGIEDFELMPTLLASLKNYQSEKKE